MILKLKLLACLLKILSLQKMYSYCSTEKDQVLVTETDTIIYSDLKEIKKNKTNQVIILLTFSVNIFLSLQKT